MSEEEDDYMSDAILQQCSAKADKNISLLPSKVARQYERETKQKEKQKKHIAVNKPQKVREREQREEGLAKSSLNSSNKGFSLLQKMGFKAGMVLGKHGTGRAEPVPINLKLGRGGLGQEAELKRKEEEQKTRWAGLNAKRRKMESRHQEKYKQQLSEKFSNREAERDLRKSQKVCEQLDASKGLKEPSERFFWPVECLPKKKKKIKDDLDMEEGYSFVVEDDASDDEDDDEEEDEDGDDDLTANEKLEVLTVYLRSSHLYCVWCGTTFNDKEDMKNSCPGDTADAHD